MAWGWLGLGVAWPGGGMAGGFHEAALQRLRSRHAAEAPQTPRRAATHSGCPQCSCLAGPCGLRWPPPPYPPLEGVEAVRRHLLDCAAGPHAPVSAILLDSTTPRAFCAGEGAPRASRSAFRVGLLAGSVLEQQGRRSVQSMCRQASRLPAQPQRAVLSSPRPPQPPIRPRAGFTSALALNSRPPPSHPLPPRTQAATSSRRALQCWPRPTPARRPRATTYTGSSR
jgi:hypothetical protein